MPNGDYVNAAYFYTKGTGKPFPTVGQMKGWLRWKSVTNVVMQLRLCVIASRFLANGIVLEECYGIAHNLDDKAVYDKKHG